MAGRARFGIAPMPARAFLAEALSHQIRAALDLTNDVVVRNVEALWPLLIAGDIEFFVSAEGQIPLSPPVRSETLGKFPYGLVVRSGHPLLTGEADRTFPVLISSGSPVQVPESLSAKLQSPPHVIEDFETLAKVAATTDAVWICSPFAVKDEIRQGTLTELIPSPSEVRQMRIVMYSLDRRSQSPAARAFRDLFRNLIQALSPR